jgi:hypothetical protein
MGELSFEGGSPFDLPGVTRVEVSTYGSRVVLNLHLPGDGSVANRERVVTVPMRAATALALGRELAAITEDLDLDEKLPDPIFPFRPKLPPDGG